MPAEAPRTPLIVHAIVHGETVIRQRLSKRPTSPASHYVYLITDCWTHVKIGHSSSPTARLSELQVGSPQDLALGHSWRLDRVAAKTLERQLHAAFAWAAARGEWFATDWRLVAQVGDLFVAGDIERAGQVAGLLRQAAANEAETQSCRTAWRGAKPKDRRSVEAAAKIRRAELEVDDARLTLALFDLGFHPPHISKHHLQVHAARERCRAIIRAAEPDPLRSPA